MKYFRIKQWEVHQHYKDRSPPWIKLHRDLLTSQTWVMLDDDKKALAVACMLLAAGTDNRIPLDPSYIQRVAYLKSTPDLQPLIDCDFIEIIEEKSETIARASTPLANASKPYSEERREEKRREEKEEKQNGHSSAVPTDVQQVFDHWKAEHKHPKAQLDGKRLKLIRVALQSYSADQLCQSISGYKNSPHHMGQNDRKTVYDDIEIFLRDAKHVDAGLKFAEKGAEQKWM